MFGYKPLIKKVEISGSSNIQKIFSLENKPIEMKAIIVKEQSVEYDAYFKEILNFRDLFKKFFLGQTEFSKECQIENIEEIVFDKKYEPYFIATCPNPIIIIKNTLGYIIECVLISFIFNNSQESVSCEFYPKFEELIQENEVQKLKWNENRKLPLKVRLGVFC